MPIGIVAYMTHFVKNSIASSGREAFKGLPVEEEKSGDNRQDQDEGEHADLE